MSRHLSLALLGAALFTGALSLVPSASAAPLPRLGVDAASPVEQVQRRCWWERRRVRTDYGWEYRRVRVCRGGYY